jgi:uncharacterized protein with PQ loop repeat
MSDPLIKDIFGYAALAFVTLELLPQCFRNYRRKSCEGLSSVMMVLGCTGCILSSVYNIVQDLALSLILQSEAWMFFALVCWIQYFHYGRRWTATRSFAVFAGIIVSVAFLQTLFVLSLKHLNDHEVTWATTAIGIIPTVLYIVGFIPQWINFWRVRCGYGISVVFVAMDIIGCTLPVISLAFHHEFDWVAAGPNAVSIVGMTATLIIALVLRRKYKDEPFISPENEVNEQANQVSSQQTLNDDNVTPVDNYEVKVIVVDQ